MIGVDSAARAVDACRMHSIDDGSVATAADRGRLGRPTVDVVP